MELTNHFLLSFSELQSKVIHPPVQTSMFEEHLCLWFLHPAQLKALFVLDLTEGSATPVPMDCLRTCTDLWTPDLRECILRGRGHIDDNIVWEVTQLCPDLLSLDVNKSHNVTDAGLIHLKGLRQLTSLNLYGWDKVTDAGLAHLHWN